MRRGYTLIEIIITVAITGILSVGMFKAFEAITTRSEKAKILTTLSIDSQSALDQMSLLLYNRAPMSAQGCDINGVCTSLDDDTIDQKILTWYGTASESYQAGDYSGFVDMNASDKNTYTLYSPDTWYQKIIDTQDAKWGSHNLGLVFAGTFEDGDRIEPYTVTITENDKIVFDPSDIPDKIYEKYYLVDSAYAVTRGEHTSCPIASGFESNDLLLFYDYRPWNGGETLCDGKVSLLSKNVNAFAAHQINGTIRLGIDMNRSVRGNQNPVRLSKQKVVF